MEFMVGAVVGFVLGFGVREAMSRYRRARARRERRSAVQQASSNRDRSTTPTSVQVRLLLFGVWRLMPV